MKTPGFIRRFNRAGRFLGLLRAGRARPAVDFHSGLGDSGWVIFGLVRALKPDVCVEIGSASGYSACMTGLALEFNGKGKLYAIDPHSPTSWNDKKSVDTLATMRRNLDRWKVSHRVEIVRQMSTEASRDWQRKIDLLFIDGDHSYDGVKRDWEHFLPHVHPDSVVVFHDTNWQRDPEMRKVMRADMGVPRFVDELRRASYPCLTLPGDFGVTLVQPAIGGNPL